MSLFHPRKSRQVEDALQESTSKPPGRKKWLGLFSGPRSRSTPTCPVEYQVDNKRAYEANKSCSPMTLGNQPGSKEANLDGNGQGDQLLKETAGSSDDDTHSVNADFQAPELGDGSTDVSRSAYRKALSSFNDEQRQRLEDQTKIETLFNELSTKDQQHQEQSLLRRGLKAVSPYLQRLNITIDFISPFTTTEPIAGTALGMIKGVTSIAIAICGASENLTNHIESFLERIPAVDRCSEVIQDGGHLPKIYKALVNVYKDLLQFYLDAITLFDPSRGVLQAFRELESVLPDIISSFNAHVDLLSQLMESETFASVQEIKKGQVDDLIHQALETGGEAQMAYHETLRQRTDKACSWIISDEAFSYWLLNTHDSNLLALLGNMGCGKTVTTAFVADSLQTQQRLLCAYYSTGDSDSTKLLSIYRSLVRQLLKRKPALKPYFLDWYRKADSQSLGNPTHSREKLEEFLRSTIASSREWVFVVLDGLDEYDSSAREGLFSLFRDLFGEKARLKVFISSRYGDDVEGKLPSGAGRIMLVPSEERDRIIANHLAEQMDMLNSLPKYLREQVIDELASRANGSGIWQRMALEYIGKLRIKNQKSLYDALADLPSTKAMADLYWRLFDKSCFGLPENTELVQQALETLAVARRPLTVEELAHAVSISFGDDMAASLSELEERAHSRGLLDFIRPFVKVVDTGGHGDSRLHLVHQSLKELIMQAPPSSWKDSIGRPSGRQKLEARRAELNSHLLGRCVKYLLLDECGDRRYLPSLGDTPGDVDMEFLAIGDIVDDDDNDDNDDDDSKGPKYFSPSELGFGGFFAYAASYWTTHFSDVSQAGQPTTEDLKILCLKSSQRLENWVEQWRRPNCSIVPEYTFPEIMERLDPLVVAAIFGSEASVIELFGCNLQGPEFWDGSVWVAVRHLINRGNISTIWDILRDKNRRSNLCSAYFFYKVLRGWHTQRTIHRKALKEWDDIFGFLIDHLRDDLLELGNEILCLAARNGCLVMVKKLFEAAETDMDLRNAILADHRSPSDRENFMSIHQSIGEAAYEGHAEIVDFLCRQTGIEPHLHYINNIGNTVFHQAARSGNLDTFRVLIQRWPEGIDIRNKQHDTPIVDLIFRSPRGELDTVEAVRVLLYLGKADVTGQNDQDGYSPLYTAIRRGYARLVRALVVEGSADVSCVVGIDCQTGKPFLTVDVNTPDTDNDRQRLLNEVCSLLPLAVSTEYLY